MLHDQEKLIPLCFSQLRVHLVVMFKYHYSNFSVAEIHVCQKYYCYLNTENCNITPKSSRTSTIWIGYIWSQLDWLWSINTQQSSLLLHMQIHVALSALSLVIIQEIAPLFLCLLIGYTVHGALSALTNLLSSYKKMGIIF